MFDPQAVQEHLLFDVVGLNGKSLIEYLRVSYNKEKKEEMLDTKSIVRQARVEQLRQLYDSYSPLLRCNIKN